MAAATDSKGMGGEGGLYDQPLVIQGKRQRKTVESFSIEHEAKAVAKYDGGKGTKLGDIPYTEQYITRHSAVDLKPLHKLCLDRPGNKLEIKKNLREFSGFTFHKESDQYKKKKASLGKLQKNGLGEFLDILGLHRTGSKEELIERILDFLLEPTDTGKAPTAKKRKKSSSGSRKPSKTSSGSKKAKRTESSDDEDGNVSFDENEDDDPNENDEDDEITAPTDDELKQAVTGLLKGADLSSVTNNSVCKQVFEKFPGVDLTTKKDFIKSCIQKSVASSS
ncbi:protein DEK-like [Halichondria panicea]|uniref:protein DEK-like n=1 Tax=Halichondria panicea TaxID=6063 RepID=UPI00312B80B6